MRHSFKRILLSHWRWRTSAPRFLSIRPTGHLKSPPAAYRALNRGRQQRSTGTSPSRAIDCNPAFHHTRRLRSCQRRAKWCSRCHQRSAWLETEEIQCFCNGRGTLELNNTISSPRTRHRRRSWSKGRGCRTRRSDDTGEVPPTRHPAHGPRSPCFRDTPGSCPPKQGVWGYQASPAAI